MSNLSNIGFSGQSAKEYGQLIAQVAQEGEKIPCEKGAYIKYSDTSGAELYCQVNKKNEILGMNPHYRGKSRFPVSITSKVQRSESALDGAFHCWADPTDKNDPESGAYPFVVDLPDFHTVPTINFPLNTEMQLAAFAQNGEFEIYASEKEFTENQKEGIKFASKSFVSIGLFSNKEDNVSPEAYALFNGIIVESEKKINTTTGKDFYWILTETLGGLIDVIADPKLVNKSLDKGSIISGQFWLSGRIIK